MPPLDPLERLAESIGDGRPLDERAAETASQQLGSSVVDNLLALAKIRELHRLPDAAEIEPTEEGQVWGQFRLLEKLGGGTFGEVWRAWDESLHRQVALKLLHSDDDGHLLGEGRLLARLHHPSIARVLQAETNDGRPGLAMELIDGSTLLERVDAKGAFTEAQVARIGAQLAGALAKVHAAGIAHGDVKAQNVVLADEDHPVLVDFGAGARRGQTAGQSAGTPAYLAPERRRGAAPTAAADVYALGVLLALLVNGRLPERDAAVSIPDSLSVVLRALDANPAERPSASEVAEKLQAAERLAAPAPIAAGASDVPPPTRSRSTIAGPLGLAAIIALVAFLVWRFAPTSAPLTVDAKLLRGAGPFESLASGSPVAAGDLLQLEVELEEPAHVYVLNRDDLGSRALLFPLPGYQTQNPVPAGRSILPGRRAGETDPVAWTLGEAGVETFLVVVTREPLRDLEREISQLPPPERSAGALAMSLDDTVLDGVYRGVTGVARVTEAPATPSTASDRVFDLAKSLDSPGAIQVLEFTLPHRDAP